MLPKSSKNGIRIVATLPTTAVLRDSCNGPGTPATSGAVVSSLFARFGLLEVRVTSRGEPIMSKPSMSTRVLNVPELSLFHGHASVAAWGWGSG